MNRVQMLKAAWMSHQKALLSLLDAVPADQVKFAPWDGAMQFGQLAIHASDDFFYKFVQAGEVSPRTPVEWDSLDDVKSIVSAKTESIEHIFDSLTDADLDKVLDFQAIGVQGPGSLFLTLAREHEIHHKGQLFVYARLMGTTEMPFFVSRG